MQGFYDPLRDRLLEPNLTGISYSFDANGHYEEAYYRALANREYRDGPHISIDSNPRPASDPACPTGLMQWQHGSYVLAADGSLTLTPIAVDGRQLFSEPCRQSIGSYTRYNSTEHFKVSPTSTRQRLF